MVVERAETVPLPLGVCVLTYVAGACDTAISIFFIMVWLSISHICRKSNVKHLFGILFTLQGTQPCVQHQKSGRHDTRSAS